MMVFSYMYLHRDLSGTDHQQLKEFLFWSLLFGPALFPVSLVIWHSYQFYKGENNFLKFENLARSRVLTSLSVLTKSSLQLVLQSTIVMITWNTDHEVPLIIFRLGSMVVSLLTIASAATSHHYFVSSGKRPEGKDSRESAASFIIRYLSAEREVKLGRRMVRLVFNISHILIRAFVISLLASYLHFLTILFIFIMIISNYCLASLTVKSNDRSKHLLTAFGSVLLPKCFVSRDTLRDSPPHYGARMFERFYRFNSVLFFIVFSVFGLITANVVIRWTDINKFTCDNLPFLSDDPDCDWSKSLPSQHILGLPQPHALFYLAGNLLVILTSGLHVLMVLLQEVVVRDALDLSF